MTAVLDESRSLEDIIEDEGETRETAPGRGDGLDDASSDAESTEPERPVSAPLVIAAGVLATLASAWMASSLFTESILAFALSAVGIAIGAGVIFLSTRFERSEILLFAVLPIAFVVGAVFSTTGEGAGLSLPTLVVEAIRGGGLRQPPIPLDPGWRFILVVLFAAVSSAGCLFSISLARPKLAVGLPVLLALGVAVLQPEGTQLAASGIALVLLVAALAVAYGAELAAEGVTSAGFEVRRFVRGGALLAGVMVALFVAAQTDFLFPETDQNQVIPPQKPPTPPPLPDEVMFTVEPAAKGPWRVGVLDVYDDNAFLLPSIDPARMEGLSEDGLITPAAGETYEVTFHVNRLMGQTLVGAPNQTKITGVDLDMEHDPRTQLVMLEDRSVPRDFTYTVEAPALPDDLTKAGAPDPEVLQEFTAMPPPPTGVQELLAKAERETKNSFDRLQFVRDELYRNVIASGAGTPVDVPPGSVEAMLAGGKATPYEITAAEVMLARWAGIPARLGFGFYGGEEAGDVLEFRPRHGAAWLEVYFEGSGWVPIVGTPPKAQASLSDEETRTEPEVHATDELAVALYIPVSRPSLRLLYELVRYYASFVVPIALGLLMLIVGYPAVLKALRSRRRVRWAEGRGPLARISIAYAELRDRCNDLNIGDVRHSPLEFLNDIEHDREHRELAWLVTRALWGDLTRDLRVEDVDAAQEMSRSVMRRVESEQNGLNRLLAWTSRASLRDPWTTEIPNLWFSRKRRSLRGRLRRFRLPFDKAPWWRLRRRLAGSSAILLVLMILLTGCGEDSEVSSPSSYPEPLMPATIEGYQIERQVDIESHCDREKDSALISGCRVYTVRDQNDAIQGSIQVSVFKPDIDNADDAVQRGVESDLGSRAAFRTTRYGTIRVRTLQSVEQQFFVWFPPERNVMELFTFRKDFSAAEQVVKAVIDHQRTASPDAPEPPVAEPLPTTTTVPEGGST